MYNYVPDIWKSILVNLNSFSLSRSLIVNENHFSKIIILQIMNHVMSIH